MHPGLVLALDAAPGRGLPRSGAGGGPDQADAVLAYLRERELISSAYIERMLTVDLADGTQVTAVTYVIDPDHVQYCGALPLEEQARIIAQAVGERGPNTEYLHNTVAHLGTLGIIDPDLDWLDSRVRDLVVRQGLIRPDKPLAGR
jgi:glutathione-specific gamma-glutamylcyclotransferase